MAEEDKDDLEAGPDAEEELEEELLEEPAEPEEDELKCEECAPCKGVRLRGWRPLLTWRRFLWRSLY